MFVRAHDTGFFAALRMTIQGNCFIIRAIREIRGSVCAVLRVDIGPCRENQHLHVTRQMKLANLC